MSACVQLIVLGLLASLAVAASPQPNQSTFRSGVDYVEVLVSAATNGGEPLRSLHREDFSVFDDGVRQTIESFEYVTSGGRPPAVLTDVATNDRFGDSRLWVLVLDDLHTRKERIEGLRRAAAQLVASRRDGDRIAIVPTSGRDDAKVEFTENAAVLLAALNHLDAAFEPRFRSTTTTVGGADLGTHFADIDGASTLADVARHLADSQVRAKAIVFISEGTSYDIANACTPLPNEMNAPTLLLVGRTKACAAEVAAGRGNVRIYSVHPEMDRSRPRGLPDGTRTHGMSLVEYANRTGGLAVLGAEEGIEKIVEDLSGYYVLRFSAAPRHADGKYHRIEVRCADPAAKLRFRTLYRAPRDKDRRDARGADRPLEAALADVVPRPGVGARLVAYALQDRKAMTIVAALDVDVPDEEADRLSRACLLVSIDRKRALTVRPQAFNNDPLPNHVLLSIEAPRDHYQLRCGVANETGVIATVYAEVDGRVAAHGPVTSPLILGVPGDHVDPWPIRPTTARLFDRRDSLTGWLRVVGEKAPAIEVSLARGEDPPAREGPAEIRCRQAVCDALYAVPLTALQPGVYTMTMSDRATGRPLGSGTFQLRDGQLPQIR